MCRPLSIPSASSSRSPDEPRPASARVRLSWPSASSASRLSRSSPSARRSSSTPRPWSSRPGLPRRPCGPVCGRRSPAPGHRLVAGGPLGRVLDRAVLGVGGVPVAHRKNLVVWSMPRPVSARPSGRGDRGLKCSNAHADSWARGPRKCAGGTRRARRGATAGSPEHVAQRRAAAGVLQNSRDDFGPPLREPLAEGLVDAREAKDGAVPLDPKAQLLHARGKRRSKQRPASHHVKVKLGRVEGRDANFAVLARVRGQIGAVDLPGGCWSARRGRSRSHPESGCALNRRGRDLA